MFDENGKSFLELLAEGDWNGAMLLLENDSNKKNAEWSRIFTPPDDPATPGVILRIPENLLKECGIKPARQVCVLAVDPTMDGDELIVVPARFVNEGDEHARVNVGEVYIPPQLSPRGYGTLTLGAIVLTIDCPLRIPVRAVTEFPREYCPEAGTVQPLPLAVPSVRLPEHYAWQRVAELLR